MCYLVLLITILILLITHFLLSCAFSQLQSTIHLTTKPGKVKIWGKEIIYFETYVFQYNSGDSYTRFFSHQQPKFDLNQSLLLPIYHPSFHSVCQKPAFPTH